MTVDLTQIILALIAGAVAIMTHKQACATVPPETATNLGNSVPQVLAATMANALANSVPARLPQGD